MAPLAAAKLPYRDINVKVTSDAYAFTSPSSPDAPAFIMDRPTGDIRMADASLLAGKRATRVSSVAGILGVIELRLDKYVVVISKAQPMGRLKGHMVYKDSFLDLLKTFLRRGPMYFSYSMDLTNSFQRQSQAETALIDFRRGGSRSQPGPQPGFKTTPLTLVLVSRRSRHRGGTRYFTRGIDGDGHVANYNETEQTLILNDSSSGLGGFAGSSDMQSGRFAPSAAGREMQVLSYVQTRGSVPTLWAEVNSLRYTPKLQVRIYGDNYLVNLVNQRGRESRVKESYERMVHSLLSGPTQQLDADASTPQKFSTISPSARRRPVDQLHYVYYDYHSETKGAASHRSSPLLDKLRDALAAQGYFCGFDTPANVAGAMDARALQTSVMRVNCMDCLDRTNVVQSIFARYTLDRMLVDTGLLTPGSSFCDEDAAFELLFRNMWADNADVVSASYAGTGAMKTDVTRTGARTKLGALQDARIGITRYLLNNFRDGPRQDAYDLFLGAYQPGLASSGSSLVFADRRPLLIQSVPYLLAFSIFVLVVGLLTRRDPASRVLPLRVLLFFWAAVAAWCFYFIWNHGMLYVNWPRLNPQSYAVDGFTEHYSKARKNALIGPFVARHERGLSVVRYSNAEEGKKRIE
ncbi:hypothetical protein CDD81_6099 [Ophiocordyceps australis]|uniref:SAC domain-containing protein n=1 Tax=Ophiocordyceps australis TaxID=1399860 RepID=A0A2C5Y1F6_9HYPO|nr:hypothetical protein CDD81_6099 [Ophiocordyceps australis]